MFRNDIAIPNATHQTQPGAEASRTGTAARADAALLEAASRHDAPADGHRAQGIVYVLFAVDHRERFKLAFRPEMGDPFASLDKGGIPEDLPAFRHLVGAVREVDDDPEAHASLTVAAWSLVHGLASLLVDGPLRAIANDRERVRALALATTSHLKA